MPFTFRVEVRESEVEGKGVFALEDIPEAAVIWVYECESPLPVLGHQFQPNRAFDCEGLSALEHEEIRLIFHSAVYLPSCDLVVNYRDGTQFTNHSADSNSQTVFPTAHDHRQLKIVSTRPIPKGEEICEDYFNLIHQTGWLTDLMEKHNPDRLAFERYILEETLKHQKAQTKD